MCDAIPRSIRLTKLLYTAEKFVIGFFCKTNHADGSNSAIQYRRFWVTKVTKLCTKTQIYSPGQNTWCPAQDLESGRRADHLELVVWTLVEESETSTVSEQNFVASSSKTTVYKPQIFDI